MQYFRM